MMTLTEYVGSIQKTTASLLARPLHHRVAPLPPALRRSSTRTAPPLPVRDTLPPRYRGFLEVDIDICTGCQACERACPIDCIADRRWRRIPTNPKQRLMTRFDIDEAKCMYCGLCVEPCPTGAIQHTREFEGSVANIRNLVFRWSDPLKPFPVYKVEKGAEYFARVPLGSLVRAKLESVRWDAAAVTYLPPEPPAPAVAPAAAPAPAAPPTPSRSRSPR